MNITLRIEIRIDVETKFKAHGINDKFTFFTKNIANS
jgi:hypothetical protein